MPSSFGGPIIDRLGAGTVATLFNELQARGDKQKLMQLFWCVIAIL
jgi:hypothetical protein